MQSVLIKGIKTKEKQISIFVQEVEIKKKAYKNKKVKTNRLTSLPSHSKP
jgi:hypothetical protein